MNTELTLALKIVQEAGYKVVEPVPEKFIPVKGQIVNIVKDGGLRLRVFDHMTATGDYSCITDGYSVSSGKCSEWNHCKPIPGLVQMEPYDPSYTGSANVLFDEGSILFFNNSQQAILRVYVNAYGNPVFFQKLGEVI